MHLIAQTNRITIREFLPAELETYLDHVMDDKVGRYISKKTREERAVIFNNAIVKYTETKNYGIWGVYNNENEFIGSCLLRPFENDPTILELGYTLEPQFWGQGLATEMVKTITDYGLANTSVKEIVACTDIPNIASQRVLLKTGFKQEANSNIYGVELTFFRLSR
jgi:ribosomal-protein-alanine N-acetyltransferase